MLNWEWYHDPVCFSVFIHLILIANIEPKKFEGIVVERGQKIVSTGKLARTLGFGAQRVRTALVKLKSTNELTIKTTNKYTLITITNYDSYQSTNEVTNKQLTNDQQTTNNNIRIKELLKNKKEEVAFSTPPNVSVDVWEAWMDVRKNKKCKFTPQAYQMILKNLAALFLEGYDLDKIISAAVVGNWTSLYPKPEDKKQKYKGMGAIVV